MEDAEAGRLRQDALPRGRVELAASGGRAPAGSSNRGSAAGSGGSARRAGPPAPARRPVRRQVRSSLQDPFFRETVQHHQDVGLDGPRIGRIGLGPARRRSSATLRVPSTSLSTATALSSRSKVRSGASRTYLPRVSSWRSRTPRGRRGRSSAAIFDRRPPPPDRCGIRDEAGARRPRVRRDHAGGDVGEVQGVELGPEHVALERQRRHRLPLKFGRGRVLLDVVQGEIGIPRRLRRGACRNRPACPW